jgi:hypothetical protein
MKVISAMNIVAYVPTAETQFILIIRHIENILNTMQIIDLLTSIFSIYIQLFTMSHL